MKFPVFTYYFLTHEYTLPKNFYIFENQDNKIKLINKNFNKKKPIIQGDKIMVTDKYFNKKNTIIQCNKIMVIDE